MHSGRESGHSASSPHAIARANQHAGGGRIRAQLLRLARAQSIDLELAALRWHAWGAKCNIYTKACLKSFVADLPTMGDRTRKSAGRTAGTEGCSQLRSACCTRIKGLVGHAGPDTNYPAHAATAEKQTQNPAEGPGKRAELPSWCKGIDRQSALRSRAIWLARPAANTWTDSVMASQLHQATTEADFSRQQRASRARRSQTLTAQLRKPVIWMPWKPCRKIELHQWSPADQA